MNADHPPRSLGNLETSLGWQKLTPDQLATQLGLSIRTLERMRCAATGPRFIKVGKKILYCQADVDAWLAERRYASTAEAKRAQH